jgi:hexosaminidase
VQPVDFKERAKQQHTSPLTPIGRFIDFARPDPPAQHDFQILVDQYLHERDSAVRQLLKERLEVIFHGWIAVAPELGELAMTHPLLAETSSRRNELPQLGRLGLRSIDSIETKIPPSLDWISTERALLQKAADHTGMVDFVVLNPLGKLLEAAASQR